MALTDEEKRQLALLEASLAADDPHLANTLRRASRRRMPVRRVVLAVVGLAIGVALLVLGMQIDPLVSVLGFLVMLVSSVAAIGSWHGGDTHPTASRRPRGQHGPRPPRAGKGDFMNRMEDRWRRRRDQGM